MPREKQFIRAEIEKETEIKLSREQKVALERMAERLGSGRVFYCSEDGDNDWIDNVLEIKEKFNLPEDAVQSVAEEAFIARFKCGRVDPAFQIKKRFNLSEGFIQPIVKRKMRYDLANGEIDRVLEIKEKFDLSEEFVQSAAKELIIHNFTDGGPSQAIIIKEGLNLPEEFLNSPEIQSAAKEGVIRCLRNAGDIETVIIIQEKFNLPKEFFNSSEVVSPAKRGMEIRLEWGDILNAVKINSIFNLGDKTLEQVANDFGDFATRDIYEAYKELNDGNISESLKQIGVKHPGEAGKNELRRGLRSFEDNFLKGGADENTILENPIIKTDVKRMVRYENSEWGGHDERDFDSTIKTYIELKDEIRPLPEEYEDSEVLRVPKIDKEAQEEFKHTEAFLTRYGTLLQSVKEARHLIDNTDGLKEVLETMKEKREHLLSEIEGDMEKQTNPKARENLLKRKELLQSVNLESIKNPQKLFSDLLSFKGTFDEELRELVFYASFKLNPNTRDMDLDEFEARKPSMEQLSQLLNFVNHITNQETLKKYFTDKEASKKFQGLVNVSALEQEMARWQNQSTVKGTMPLQFSPHRDLLTEFSGHIADACWASKYESILKEFPNFISLIMVQNPESEKDRRLAGSSMLIETESEDSEPLLVIRGLNPQENIINQLSVEDFYEQLVAYLKPIAEKQGRKLAITIDYHSGGSGTNRPTLFAFLDELRDKLEKVYLKSYEDTEFNGYDIKNDVYLI
jgi:hypothetical protein